jgi:radical SAM superfamily enzyme YgiQ (UPF0313 family)
MRLTLVFPGIGRRLGQRYLRLWQMEPLSMAVLAALTPADVDLRFYDDRVERVPFDEPTDLVAMTVETYTARRAYQIASEYRRRGVPVVMGGFHATLASSELERYADAVVVGEAEGLWAEVLDDFRHGTPRKYYRANARPSLDGVVPNRAIFRGKRYLPLALVESGRGCLHTCEFCSIQSMYQATLSRRPLDTVVAELTALRKTHRPFFFVDDNVTAHPAHAKEFLRAIAPLGIRWMSQMGIAAAHDEEMLDLLQRSGCAGVLIGFESLDPANLEAMGKGFNAAAGDYATAVANLHRHRIGVYGTFVFGYDHDTPESFSAALQFAERHGLYLAAFNHVVPFPGTPLHRRLEQQGRLLSPAWWLDADYRFNGVAFRPEQISPEQLRARCMEARRAFYAPAGIWRRQRVLRRHLGLGELRRFWTLNLLHRAEVGRRDGFPLGDEAWHGSLLEVG